VRVYPRAEAGETVIDLSEFWFDDETCEEATIHRLLKFNDGAKVVTVLAVWRCQSLSPLTAPKRTLDVTRVYARL